MKTLRFVAALAFAMLAGTPGSGLAQDKGKTQAAELAGEAKAALQTLSGTVPLANELAKTAAAILVFPEITKAGFGIEAYGEGTLLKKGAAVAYYKTTGASFGLQAGGQSTVTRCSS